MRGFAAYKEVHLRENWGNLDVSKRMFTDSLALTGDSQGDKIQVLSDKNCCFHLGFIAFMNNL